ncbi:MAG: hypothetical protein HRT87_09025 [Legionellales bacterium]|nr:hypothetical protein [Legionellales bacterium]
MNKKRYIDPYADEEAKKYAKPIPSRKFILELLEEVGAPVNFKTLVRKLGITKNTEQEALKRRLNAMVRDAQLMRDLKKRF